MAILNNNPLVGASGNQGGYNINNSLRFRSSASAYLSRTPASAGNRQIWTWSCWVKKTPLASGVQAMIAAGVSTTVYDDFCFENDQIRFVFNNGTYDVKTTQVFRDPSAWYHVIVAMDTTQATASNRVKIYVNGSQVTAFATANYPAQNHNTNINNNILNNIGNLYNGSFSSYFDGYMTEVNFIDGSAKTPSDFGETDTTTGVWKPKAYSGTYGTNGFYLKFSDIATTSGSNAGLGKDFSGNANYWTTNNISVTAGTTYDAMTDVPTNTSATVANYCVLNPLNKSTNVTVSNANLTSTSAVTNAGISGTMYIPSTGKYYWEATCTTKINYPIVGIANAAWNLSYPGATSGSYGYANDGLKYNNGSTSSYGATYTSGDIIGVAFDADAGTLTFYKNNTSQGTAYTGLTDSYTPAISGQTSDVWNMNFGQRPFSYTPPTGYVALNTYNLPTPTILAGNKYMDATLWTGNGSTQTVVNAGQFKPDFVWIKRRDGAGQDHVLQDSNRGFSGTTKLASSSTAAENTTGGATGSEWGYVTAANSNGFSITASTNGDQVNKNTWTYVGWQWQAGQGSTSSNTAGSITSTVSVNTTAGFSVVTYTGTGANATVGHGLGVAPKMVIVKIRNGANDWFVWHTSLTSGAYYLNLNATSAQQSNSVVWNNTIPTSSVFSLGTSSAINGSTNTYVAYCWAAIPGFSAFGSYTGNGSADGPMIYCNFSPKFFLVKRTDTVESWNIVDTSRNTYNQAGANLYPNLSNAESTNNSCDILSNGIKLRNTWAGANANGGTYIFMAFASNPFKSSNAR